MTDVFISYKRRMRPQVEHLAAALRALQLTVWFDARLEPGVSFSAEISHEVRNSKCVLVCWTNDCFPHGGDENGWVLGEATIGRERGVAVPVLLEPTTLDPPWNTVHTESLVGWARADGLGAIDAQSWRDVLTAIGRKVGRLGLADYVRAIKVGTAGALKTWAQSWPDDPLADEVWSHVETLEADALKARLAHERSSRAAPPPPPASPYRVADPTPDKPARAPLQLPKWVAPSGVVALLVAAVVVALAMNVGREPADEAAVTEPAPPQDSVRRAFEAARDGASVQERAFRDCADVCPEMLMIPAGSFTQGSPATEPDRSADEGPQRSVNIAAFAVGKHEVTLGEWKAFVAATSRPNAPNDCYTATGQNGSWRAPGFAQDDGHPVACVNWRDAQDYAKWLSGKTGQTYRLLSESEWEYAARAGTTTPFWWGSKITTAQANYNGDYTYNGGAKGENRARTTPVGVFESNPFGLYDVHGNVWEWVEDCYADNYTGLATDGSANVNDSCSYRVLRGGSWISNPRYLRSALRNGGTPSVRYSDVGFRLARTVLPPAS